MIGTRDPEDTLRRRLTRKIRDESKYPVEPCKDLGIGLKSDSWNYFMHDNKPRLVPFKY